MEHEKPLKTSDFNYDLPKTLIAQSPIENRDQSRLLVLDKENGAITHRHFFDIVSYLNPGDCLVLNDTKVMPARLLGHREKTGAKIEILLLTRKSDDIWEVLVRPGKKALPGDIIIFGDGILKAQVLEVAPGGNRYVQFKYEGIFEQVLDVLGEMPLPPYITERLDDKTRYQTVYAKETGSAAAPTAGLHFTEKVLREISAKGVEIAEITLHVGLGTFRPVKTDDVSTHEMHSEFFNILPEEAEKINSAKRNGGRIIAVGTTSCRTLESSSAKSGNGSVTPGNGWTDIFIYPPYQFKCIDALITNFHLPESTLIMLVSALAGKENVLNAYKTAVETEYRFFSFGDCMFIK